jgi:hypothetical protein
MIHVHPQTTRTLKRFFILSVDTNVAILRIPVAPKIDNDIVVRNALAASGADNIAGSIPKPNESITKNGPLLKIYRIWYANPIVTKNPNIREMIGIS